VGAVAGQSQAMLVGAVAGSELGDAGWVLVLGRARRCRV